MARMIGTVHRDGAGAPSGGLHAALQEPAVVCLQRFDFATEPELGKKMAQRVDVGLADVACRQIRRVRWQFPAFAVGSGVFHIRVEPLAKWNSDLVQTIKDPRSLDCGGVQ
jgi:hypothetical protein